MQATGSGSKVLVDRAKNRRVDTIFLTRESADYAARNVSLLVGYRPSLQH